ncbi:glycosyltransferase family A protein [Bordetella tumulicola]|uniref:glycosyltransferase family A protein n=1 Tax=Bordetella tumulicola TaxID=1649133 RepID=UPI0039EF35E0
MEKVIISLAAISSRMANLHLTLVSLLEQDFTDFEIRVHVSPDAFLLDEGVVDIPVECQKLLERTDKIKWLYTRNIGSYRKLLPVLADPLVNNALIVTADDDTVYPADWLSTLVYYYRRYHCIISYRGHNMRRDANGFVPYRRWMKAKIGKNPSLFLLPTGKDGVLYHTSFFDRDVLNVHQAMRLARTADDLWFKWHTAINDIPVYMVHTDYSANTLVATDDNGPSLYLMFNEKGGNDKAIHSLESYLDSRGQARLASLQE